MNIPEFVQREGGIVHRQSVLDAGARPAELRAAIVGGDVQRVRRYWIADPSAPPLLRTAAERTARVACLSAARHRRWWIPPDADARLHLHVHPTARRPTVLTGPADPAGQVGNATGGVTGEVTGAVAGRLGATVHWNRPLVPVSRYALVESIVDSLEHIADCVPREQAIVLWESAVRTHSMPLGELRGTRWRSVAARGICAILTGQSGSGIETMFVVRLATWGLPIRQQVPIAGHDVDALIGDLLVVQLDGFAFHSGSAERTRDLAHDRALIALGYTVLRFSYSEVIYNWPAVEHSLARAIAQGLHLAR